jgi:hypothetical protein
MHVWHSAAVDLQRALASRSQGAATTVECSCCGPAEQKEPKKKNNALAWSATPSASTCSHCASQQRNCDVAACARAMRPPPARHLDQQESADHPPQLLRRLQARIAHQSCVLSGCMFFSFQRCP